MLHDTMSHAGLSLYTEIATIVMVVLIAAILAYLFLWRKKAYWQRQGELPLSDGAQREPTEPRAGSRRVS